MDEAFTLFSWVVTALVAVWIVAVAITNTADLGELRIRAVRDGCAVYDDKQTFVWKGKTK